MSGLVVFTRITDWQGQSIMMIIIIATTMWQPRLIMSNMLKLVKIIVGMMIRIMKKIMIMVMIILILNIYCIFQVNLTSIVKKC